MEIRSAMFGMGREESEWELTNAAQIKWVRLVRDRGGLYGIGFREDQLIHFLGPDETAGLARRISAFESAVLLQYLAGRELFLQPDVESNPTAWRRWLELLIADCGSAVTEF